MRGLLAAFMLACALPAYPQDGALGRLFFTPQQRATLDRQRRQSPNESQVASDKLNGEVRRSSGKNTRWINGAAHYVNDAPLGVSANAKAQPSGESQKQPDGVRVIVSPGRTKQ